MLSCKRIRRELGAYLYDDLNPRERGLVEDHVARCQSCQYELNSRKETLSFLSRVATSTSATADVPGPGLACSVLRRVEREALLGRQRESWFGRWARSFTEHTYLPSPASLRPAVGWACAALVVGLVFGAAGGNWHANSSLSVQLGAVKSLISQEGLLTLAHAKTDLLRKGDVGTADRLQQLELLLQDIGFLENKGDVDAGEEWECMRKAEQQFLKGDYRAAFEQYQHLAANYPKHDSSKFAAQMVAFIADEKLGDPALAVKEYRKIASLDDRPEVRAEALFECGRNCLELGEHKAALEDFQKLVTCYPSSVYWGPSQILLGDIYFDNMADYGRALAAYASYFREFPEEFNNHPRRERAILLAENHSNNWEPIRLYVEVQKTNEKATMDRLLTRYGNSSLVQKVGLGSRPVTDARAVLTSY